MTVLERALLPMVVLVALFVFLPSLGGEPLDWDDPVWLADPLLRLGPLEALRTAFGETHDHVWSPMLRMSSWLAAQVFGAWVLPRHAVNVLLFLGCIGGVHRLLGRMGVPPWPAGLAVAMWALHPSRVESVAWLTGLKDVQSLALLVAAALWLIPEEGEKQPTVQEKVAGTVLGTLGLLTKGALFPVPLALLAVVWVRRGRLAALSLLPLGAISLGVALVGRVAWEPHDWPAIPRALLPLWVHGTFWQTLFLPSPPAIVAIPADSVPVALLGIVCTGLFGLAAWRWPKVAGPLLLVWLLPQVPFLGLVPMAFWGASRHLLVPMLGVTVGVALLLEQALAGLVARGLAQRATLLRGMAVVLLCWPVFTWDRVGDWRSSRALWESEVARADEHWVRWLKVGTARGRDGAFREAEQAFDRALLLEPDPDTLARRLIASLAADGWTGQDAALVRSLEPPPAGAEAWLAVIAKLREAGEEELATVAEGVLRRTR